MGSSAEAEECIRVMDGRFFAGRTIEAFFYDGKTAYNVIGKAEAPRRMVPQSTGPAPPPDPEPSESEKPEEKAEATPAAEPEPAAPGAQKSWEEWLAGDGDSS